MHLPVVLLQLKPVLFKKMRYKIKSNSDKYENNHVNRPSQKLSGYIRQLSNLTGPKPGISLAWFQLKN